MPKKNKKPTISSNVSVTKRPGFAGGPDIDGGYLAWRLSSRDFDGPFSWTAISDDEMENVRKRMIEFEKMNAAQLKDARSNHRHSVSSIEKEARDRLHELDLDDLDELVSFRVSGERRFWCIKHESIYALIWWDPEHKVYITPKKNT